jgi:hypothetical protein
MEEVLFSFPKTFSPFMIYLSNIWKRGLISLTPITHIKSSSYHRKREPTNSDFKDKNKERVSNLKTSTNLNELYKEFYKIKATHALFLNNKSKHTLNVQMLHDYSRLYYLFLRATLTCTTFSQL